MSCDWDVYCLDCNQEHGFDGANHCDGEMADLCAVGPKIRKLFLLLRDLPLLQNHTLVPEGLSDRHRLDPAFWIAHGEHRIVPRDEYGRILGECSQQLACDRCGCSQHVRCVLPANHEGGHSPKRP